MIDTHTHVYLPDYADDRREVMARAREAGVEMMVMPCVDVASLPMMKAVAEEWPAEVRMAVGLHPTEMPATREELDAALALFEKELRDNPGCYVAIGEVGVDLHWDTSTLPLQLEAFRRQALMALEHDLPLIIHSRDALEETLGVLAALPEVPPLVFHSFGGTEADVAAIRAVAPEAYFGLNGVATFKNCHVRDSVSAIGLDRLVLETDSPWLAPVPHRGKRCEPAHTALVLNHLAAHLGITPAELDRATTANAKSLFKL